MGRGIQRPHMNMCARLSDRSHLGSSAALAGGSEFVYWLSMTLAPRGVRHMLLRGINVGDRDRRQILGKRRAVANEGIRRETPAPLVKATARLKAIKVSSPLCCRAVAPRSGWDCSQSNFPPRHCSPQVEGNQYNARSIRGRARNNERCIDPVFVQHNEGGYRGKEADSVQLAIGPRPEVRHVRRHFA